MFGKLFWQNLLRDGAILGVVMALSHIFESYFLFGDISMGKASLVVSIEMLIVAVFFVWYIYRSVKRRSLEASDEQGFAYSTGLFYIFLMSVLTGVLVGLGQTIFVGVIGYDTYIEGIISRYEDMMSLMPMQNAMFEEMLNELSSSPKPSVFDNVIASVNNYIISGGIIGLLVAGVVRRDPNPANFQE